MKQRLIDANALMEYCNNLKNKTIDANDIARFPAASGWISVKDKTPEDGVEVLVWDDGGFAYIDTWVGHTWKYGGDLGVTHWMPMPEPPKEETP